MSSSQTDMEECVFEALPDVFLEVNARGKIIRYIGGGINDTHLCRDTLVGQHFDHFWPAAAARSMLDNIRKAIRSRSTQVFNVDLAENSVARYEVRLFVRGRQRLLAVIRPISLSSPDKREQSFVDTLTGLATRERFLMEFEHVLVNAKLRERGVGLMCIDINRFTRINETLGRAVGDQVLRIAAQRIDSCFRNFDRLVKLKDEHSAVARIGGDEFLLVLGGISSREDIRLLSERVIASFVEPLQCGEQTLEVTPSIGIALFPQDGTDAETLLVSARSALNHARDFGATSGIFCTASDSVVARSDLGQELRWALEQDQLELHYLPRFDLKSNKVTAIEALLRWHHPVRGSVPVNEIIPLAETTGLMRPIGEWALAKACELARHLCDELDDVPIVSINLSQREFSRTDLPELVANALRRTGLDGCRLQMEFTESALMQNRQSISALCRMEALGVNLAIDDFGTGHVSLQQLKALPISAVKIDRCFVEGLPDDPDSLSLCSAIISMCHHLDLAVIAEGVETSQQVTVLNQCGCDAAQGFYFSKPLPSGQVLSYLATLRKPAESLPA